MELILFSKSLKGHDLDSLVSCAEELGIDGYDMCVRPDYPVNPDNVRQALPDAAKRLAGAGRSIPLVTGNFDLLTPDHPTAEPILAAMAEAGVRFLKLGYFKFDPKKQDYWSEVDGVRRAFEGWSRLAEKHGVKVCYHTHSNYCMGLNCSALMHLMREFDPRFIGAYIDTAHMTIEGEAFDLGLAMVKDYLCLCAVKDTIIWREDKNGHGCKKRKIVPAGEGMVDWTTVFDELARVGFDGPLSVHGEFANPGDEDLIPKLKKEVACFKAFRDKGTAG